jgi:hypothetical protein
MVEFNVEILQPDGTPIGSIMATGMNGSLCAHDGVKQ